MQNNFKYYFVNLLLYLKCKKDKIPIIRKNTAKYIFKFIKNKQYKTILEIGTAYGLSSLIFSKLKNIKQIDTIEKKQENFMVAKSFIKSKKINLINNDCFNFDTTKKYDVIFLDGPKSHQDKLVIKFLKNLNDDGVMFVDNLYLKNIKNPNSKHKQKLLKKIEQFNIFLKESKEFLFEEVNIDDGLGIIYKRK